MRLSLSLLSLFSLSSLSLLSLSLSLLFSVFFFLCPSPLLSFCLSLSSDSGRLALRAQERTEAEEARLLGALEGGLSLLEDHLTAVLGRLRVARHSER
jgi:hypothetical protein